MASKKNKHEIWKRELARVLITGTPRTVAIAIEPSLYLSDATFTEPDILVHQQRILPEDVRGADVMLLVEIADSSIDRDMKLKRAIYAHYGVPHYWVLDAENRKGYLFSEPKDGQFAAMREVGAEETLTTPFGPAISFKLLDLG